MDESSKRTQIAADKAIQKEKRLRRVRALKRAGYTNVEIAKHLGISESTVRNDLRKIDAT
jgi:DNA-binding CsgD family transcriptional regulator